MQEAMVIDPDNLDYMKMLAQALDQAGKKAEANELLKKIVGLDKDPWYAYLTLAKNYEDTGNFDSALAMMKQFQAMHPGDRRASQMITRYEAMKRDEGAMDTSMKPAGAEEEKPKG